MANDTPFLVPDAPQEPWWRRLLHAGLPAVGASLSAFQGRSPAPYFEALDEANDQQRATQTQRQTLAALGPMVQQYPELKAMLPLLATNPKLLDPFMKHLFDRMGDVPATDIPGADRVLGYASPPEPPLPQSQAAPPDLAPYATAPGPFAIGAQPAPLRTEPNLAPPTLPPDPQAQQQYTKDKAAYDWARTHTRMRPEQWADALAKTNQNEALRAEREQERKKATVHRDEERRRTEQVRLDEHLRAEAAHQAQQLEGRKLHLAELLAKEGVAPEDITPVLEAKTMTEAGTRFSKASGDNKVPLLVEGKQTLVTPLAYAQELEREDRAKTREFNERLRRDAERDRQVREYDARINAYQKAASDEARLLTVEGKEKAVQWTRYAEKLRADRAKVAWPDAARVTATRAQIVAKLATLPRATQLKELERIQWALHDPDPITNTIFIGVTPDDLMDLRDEIMRRPPPKTP